MYTCLIPHGIKFTHDWSHRKNEQKIGFFFLSCLVSRTLFFRGCGGEFGPFFSVDKNVSYKTRPFVGVERCKSVRIFCAVSFLFETVRCGPVQGKSYVREKKTHHEKPCKKCATRLKFRPPPVWSVGRTNVSLDTSLFRR